jgi:hypothetical protein
MNQQDYWMVANPPTVSWEEANADRLNELFPDEEEAEDGAKQ